jgi:hypothetical protein
VTPVVIQTRAMLIDLTPDEIALLIAALDSHAYWQLADEHYRDNGAVIEPGSDDAEKAAAIEAVGELSAKLEAHRL